ncbi:Crp/Fnr family transcriptional regulator [Rhodopila sp.]|uniref:Crp/Fnr family transcriptional regulator n=1 Tax=Rhodopila sp. TaxID=2480087 RepID=UPI003D0F31BA
MPVPNELPTGRRGRHVAGDDIDPAVIYSAAAYDAQPIPTAAEAATDADPTVRRLIAAHPALGTLPRHEHRTLLRGSRIRPLKRQELIFRQGDAASSVALVLEGFVKLSVPLADGGELVLDIAGPGACIGEISVLHARTRGADAAALAPGRLLIIDARQFRQTFDRMPEGLLALLRLASRKLQRATGQLIDSRARSALARLAKTVLQVARLAPSDPHHPGGLGLRLSQGEWGLMAGMSRELVNKHLGVWRDAGWISLSGGTVTSVDIAALEGISGDDQDGDADPG